MEKQFDTHSFPSLLCYNTVFTYIWWLVIFPPYFNHAQNSNDIIDLRNTSDETEFITFTDEKRRQVCKHIRCEEYCTIRCGLELHTVCKHRCGESSLCRNFRVQAMKNSIRLYIRNMHNYYRQMVALGKDTRGGNYTAKNMRVLNYHMDLEALAYCWAQRCVEAYDGCRRLIWIPTAGQNMYTQRSKEPYSNFSREYFATAFEKWYKQIMSVTPSVIESFPEENATEILHFSQMIWSNSRYTYIQP